MFAYSARQMASRMVDFPEPVFPVIRNTSLSRSGSCSKSMVASSMDAMLWMMSFCIFMILLFFMF